MENGDEGRSTLKSRRTNMDTIGYQVSDLYDVDFCKEKVSWM